MFKLLLPVRKRLLDTRSKVSKGSLCNTVQLCFAFTLGLRPSLGKNDSARPWLRRAMFFGISSVSLIQLRHFVSTLFSFVFSFLGLFVLSLDEVVQGCAAFPQQPSSGQSGHPQQLEQYEQNISNFDISKGVVKARESASWCVMTNCQLKPFW